MLSTRNSASKLRSLREKLGMTQHQLAEALGVHPVTVAKWEAGMQAIPDMALLASEHLRCIAEVT